MKSSHLICKPILCFGRLWFDADKFSFNHFCFGTVCIIE